MLFECICSLLCESFVFICDLCENSHLKTGIRYYAPPQAPDIVISDLDPCYKVSPDQFVLEEMYVHWLISHSMYCLVLYCLVLYCLVLHSLYYIHIFASKWFGDNIFHIPFLIELVKYSYWLLSLFCLPSDFNYTVQRIFLGRVVLEKCTRQSSEVKPSPWRYSLRKWQP